MKIAFLVSKKFGLEILKSLKGSLDGSLIIHPNDSDDKRSCMSLFNDFCREEDLDIMIAPTKTHSEQILIDYQPDLVFVCGWYWIIPDSVINIPKIGTYGIHNSILPSYRGGSPLVWSIIDGGHTVGSSLFKFDAGMDTGDIAHQFQIEFNRDNNIHDALVKIENEYTKILPKIWSDLVNDKLALKKQNPDNISYCAQRIETDGKVNWNAQPSDIHDFIRSQSFPYPYAFTVLNDVKVKIAKTTEINESYMSTPGQVIKIGINGSVFVGTGSYGVISLDTLVTDTGQEVKASEIIKTIKTRFV